MTNRPPLPSFSPTPFGGQAYVALVLIAAIAFIAAGFADDVARLIREGVAHYD